jgi:hypothetical protein
LLTSGHLTKYTLETPFDYEILGKVKELTGINSELRNMSRSAAASFFDFWEVFFELEKITVRGKYGCGEMTHAERSHKKRRDEEQKIRFLEPSPYEYSSTSSLRFGL